MIRFGPSGNSDIFYEQGYKKSQEMPGWLKAMGLSAYEYSCSKGIRIKKDTAREIGKSAIEHDIHMSVHAPYYVNFASLDEEKRINSINYILDTLQVADWLGAKRIVVHTGSVGRNMARNNAMELALPVFSELIRKQDEMGYSHITLCPEVLGKNNQLGSLEEILIMCGLDDRIIPCIDFGHIHARSMGGLKAKEDYQRVLDIIKDSLGEERLKKLHIHFSRVEYTNAGERRHLTMKDTDYGPEFEPLAILIREYKMNPVVICESRGTMAEDAKELQEIYEKTEIYIN